MEGSNGSEGFMPTAQPCEICGTPEEFDNDTYRAAKHRNDNSAAKAMGFRFERVCTPCKTNRTEEFEQWKRGELKNWDEQPDGFRWRERA